MAVVTMCDPSSGIEVIIIDPEAYYIKSDVKFRIFAQTKMCAMGLPLKQDHNGPFHFYHRGAVRLSRQRQRGVIEQSGAQGAAPGHKSREAAPAREGASLKGGLGEDRERNALRGCSASADPP